MLLWFTTLFTDYFHALSVFGYISLRTILAALTALVLSLWLGPKMIVWLQSKQMGQQVRDDGPKSHFDKAGTPTMGGVMVLGTITLSCLLWADLSNRYIWLMLFVTLGYGAIGWVDDYRKIIQKNTKGLSGRWKLLFQSLIGLSIILYLYFTQQSAQETWLIIPFFKQAVIPLGVFYIVLAYFVIVGSSNAVNLTDGLDGLAILPVVLVGAALGVFAYLAGHVEFSKYLSILYVPGSGELAVFCGALVGAGLGFLWFNAYPAQVFMGDVGALALGGALGLLAVIVRQEIVFFIMGGVFVMETISVILQVLSFKLRGKRVFKMAPIHHHFELGGWPEPRVVVRFWIMTVILVLIGLASLKIR
tara:strand:+ start:52382 stop:53464 length:1083 start_codon:yes stop_codon:yes gene_type:complete